MPMQGQEMAAAMSGEGQRTRQPGGGVGDVGLTRPDVDSVGALCREFRWMVGG